MKRLRIKASSPDQRVGDLSGGNQQKVLLARLAVPPSPKVLLLDEPTRGIDVGAKAEVQALIDELAAEGLGVVLVSSELEELIEGVRPRRGAARRRGRGRTARRRGHRGRPDGRAVAARRATSMSDHRRGADPGRAGAGRPGCRDYGVYAALVLLLLFNLVFTANFLTVGNFRTQLVQVAPVVDRRARHGAGDRHRGRRPVGRLGDGAGRGRGPALPRLRVRGRDRWSRCSPGLLVGLVNGALVARGRRAADRRDPGAVRRRPRAGAGARRRAAQGRSSDPTFLASAPATCSACRSSWSPRRCWPLVVGVRGAPHDVRPAAASPSAATGRAAELAGLPVKRVLLGTYVICGVLAAVAGVLATARLQASDPSDDRPADRAVRDHRRGGRRHPADRRPGPGARHRRRRAADAAASTPRSIKHNSADSWAQIAQAVIIIAAVYLQLGRGRKG